MGYRVIFSNDVGVLDHSFFTEENEEAAGKIAIEIITRMMDDCEYLSPGDSFTFEKTEGGIILAFKETEG